LAGVAAVGGYAAARLGAARLGAAGALLGVTLPLMVWNPLGLVILGGQSLVLLVDRTPQGSAAITQAARVLGLCAAVLVSGGAVSPLVVTLLAAALAPSALVALSAPVREPAAEPVAREDAPPPPAPTPTPAAESAPAPPPAPTPDPETAPAPKPDTATPGLFGPDPVAALAHLTPAPALVEAARTALANAQPAVLALVRMDGLAGIAEHLGTEGGETLFAAATERLAAALPQAGTLSWVGDETFVALVPVAQADDVADLGPRLAAPFAEDLIVDGRPISMEDALHVEALMLDAETLEELAGWVRAG